MFSKESKRHIKTCKRRWTNNERVSGNARFLVRSIVRGIEFKKEGNEIHRKRIKTASKTTRLSIRDDAGNRTCDGISINS